MQLSIELALRSVVVCSGVYVWAHGESFCFCSLLEMSACLLDLINLFFWAGKCGKLFGWWCSKNLYGSGWFRSSWVSQLELCLCWCHFLIIHPISFQFILYLVLVLLVTASSIKEHEPQPWTKTRTRQKDSTHSVDPPSYSKLDSDT